MVKISKVEPLLINKPQFDHGKSALIYDLLDGTCYKKFYNYDYVDTRDQLEVLTRISNLELHNFCKILEIIYDGERVLGYIMVKYDDLKDKSILSSHKDFLITNYDGLVHDIQLLSDNLIIVEDLKEHNVILTEDKIVVHDYDLYRIAGTKERNIVINKARLNCLINDLLYDDKHIHYEGVDSSIFSDNMYELINARSDGNTIREVLKDYDRPIDYLGGYHEKRR